MATQLNLNRLGHYFTPQNAAPMEVAGSCQTALIVGPGDISEHPISQPLFVNLSVWQHDGEQFVRRVVLASPPVHGQATYHLQAECPWHR